MQVHMVKSHTEVHGIGISRPARRRTSGLASWFGARLRRLTNEFARWRRVQRDLHKLRSLDDRMLADIGITRCDVEHVVRHGRRAPGVSLSRRNLRRRR
jgi:uncharacterized protein YjiS (DUF1127 family)